MRHVKYNSMTADKCVCGNYKLRLPTVPSYRGKPIYQFRCAECSYFDLKRLRKRSWAIGIMTTLLLTLAGCHYDSLIRIDMRRQCDCPTTQPATDDQSVGDIVKDHL